MNTNKLRVTDKLDGRKYWIAEDCDGNIVLMERRSDAMIFREKDAAHHYSLNLPMWLLNHFTIQYVTASMD